MEKQVDLRQTEDMIKGTDGSGKLNEDTLISKLCDEPTNGDDDDDHVDTGKALQMFLDHIPISSIPGIRNPPVLELKTDHSVKDAIHLMYKKNVSGAPIADHIEDSQMDTITTQKFLERYIGFIDFAKMVLWCLEEFEKLETQTSMGKGNQKMSFFSMLEEKPDIGQTKVGELAKSFLWDPFFPANLDDTLFPVLLLLSKHRLQSVPVIDQHTSQAIGFVTPNAVIQLLLRSSGLVWFDCVADKVLKEFRFEDEDNVAHVYADRSLAQALHVLWKSKIGAIAVVSKETRKLIGTVRNSDVYHLLENGNLYNKLSLPVEEFIHSETDQAQTDSDDPTIDRNVGALLSAGTLCLRNKFLPTMDSPITCKQSDTLKQAMEKLADTKGNFCFLVDEEERLAGVLTFRDIIMQFAPPFMDSGIRGGGFFETALEQTGCQVQNHTIVCDH